MSNPFEIEPVRETPELARIRALPRRTYTADEIAWLVDRMTALLKTPGGTMRLFPIQAIALWELMNYGGLLGAMPVGSGKELVCFLSATVIPSVNPILLMPASLIERSEDERRNVYGPHWRLNWGQHLLSFSKLGLSQYADALTVVEPGLLTVNEAHKLKNPKAACTRRYHRLMKKFPGTVVVDVSGTLLAKSLRDFAPLVRTSVKAGSPVPMLDHDVKEWADALDEKSDGWQQRDPGALMTLCNEEELRTSPDRITAARRGFRRRLTETPGVVAYGEDDVANAEGDPVRIHVRAIDYYQDPIVEKHFDLLRNKWETPNGWAFSIAMGVWQHARELAVGLHQEWDPLPPGGPMGPWMMSRRAWAKFVRETIKGSRSGVYDSEEQVKAGCERGALDGRTYGAWEEIKPSFVPRPRAVWHCTGALHRAAQWASEGPGVIFSDHSAFGHRLAAITGMPYFGREGIDRKTGIRIDDPKHSAALSKMCVIASRQANSTGRNIQFWNRGLVTAAPMNALEWEQLIGRFHRRGQQADDVTFDVLLGCVEHFDGWTRSLALAKMTRDMLGAPQKLLIATPSFPTEDEIEWRGGMEGAHVFKWHRVSSR